ncbi:hypothetical protein ACHAXR_007278 [Thalassiosira sp. AJA248-18]
MASIPSLVATITTVVVLFSAAAHIVYAQDASPPGGAMNFPDLAACVETSFAMSKFGLEDAVAPCILYDIQDYDDDSSSNSTSNNTTTAEVTLVQVTPSMCHNHRDGAVTSVHLLNGDNNGQGMAIGYNRDHYVKFRLISIIGGNSNNIGNSAYSEVHSAILDSIFESVENVQYILGSCSFASVADKPIALKRQKVVISQVGPPGFYMDVETNPYVFGIHVNSDTYPLPAISALTFQLNSAGIPTSTQQVRIMYRDKSEFFYSTCRSAVDAAIDKGFDVTAIEYDPDGDENGNGVLNSQDIQFLEKLADELCPPINDDDDVDADAILARMRSNGCRPSLAWFTTATWGWAGNNPEVIPFFQGGGQWHETFVYSDQFFKTGQEVLDYGLKEFGYIGSYDHVVSYAMPTLVGKLIESFFRVEDLPDVTGTFRDRYEVLRRALVNINAQTIFGPVQFNQYQRNNGRGAAGMQWIPSSMITSTSHAEVDFVLGCTSPLDQANAAIVIPSPSGSVCDPGSYTNQTLIEIEPDLLGGKCSACPMDSYTAWENNFMQCDACPPGSTTAVEAGATNCVQLKENLIGGLQIMGYIFVVISWAMAFGYIAWVVINKNDPVVKVSQPEFLLLICIGAVISTSAIIPWTLAEAGVGEDTAAASRNCIAWPWLYSIGFVLMYSSLTAKSFRLLKIARAAANMRRTTVAAKEMYTIIIVFLVLDIAILAAWTTVDPLKWTRREVSTSVVATGVVTVETIGKCDSDNMWYFLGPIIAVHVSLMIITNILLWEVRNMSDRYQEQKFVAIASVYICELLVLGVPILLAVQDSASARYIVISGVIFLTDTGVLALIFLPKIKFQREGLPEGVTVAQSMNVHSIRRRSTVSSN